MANGRGGTVVLGVEDKTREIVGVPLDDLDTVEGWDERQYLAKLDGSYEIGECYITISIGDLFEDAHYKLIAAIIEPDRR